MKIVYFWCMCGSGMRQRAAEYRKQGYRVIDTSRSREHRMEGMLLGLSIANKIVEK